MKKMEVIDPVTLSEAATLAGVSKRTIWLHMKKGDAPEHGYIGREVVFRKADIIAWRDKHYGPDKPRKGRRKQA